LLAALLFSWRIGRPSPWWDEAITRDVTSRPASGIIDLAGHIDLVHTTYYLLVHALIGESTSVTPIRLLSMAAAALTAVALVRLGRELGSAPAGVFAGALFMIAPLSSRYAQEARPYAMVALAATLSTLALVRLCRRPWLPARWIVYVASLVAVGLLNVLALLMIVVHLCYVLPASSKAVRRRWYAASAGAVALLSPLLYASAAQREQVAWLPKPGVEQLTGFLVAQYATAAFVVVLLVLAVGGLAAGTHAPSLGLGLAWAFIPPVLLWTLSQAHPLFDWRYVFFTVPGGALAIASLAPLLRARLMTAAVVVLALLGLHMQNVYRYSASGHGENLRGAAEAIHDHAQAGDAVIFLPESRRVVKLAYPEAFGTVDDVALSQNGEQSTTLMGVEEPTEAIAKELKHRNRIWVVTGSARFGEGPTATETAKEHMIYDHFRLSGVALTGRYEVRLYVRSRSAIPSPGIQESATQQTR
jgi:mannosyltransferase